MGARPETGRGWAGLMVALAGMVPFASDMLRNFQLFAPPQLAWSFAAVLAATGGAYALAWTILRGIEAALRRAGRPPGPRLRSVVFALAAALVFAGFLYDANMTELRVAFGLPRPAAAAIVVALFGVYWAVAARLGAKRTCGLLLALLAFRSVRAFARALAQNGGAAVFLAGWAKCGRFGRAGTVVRELRFADLAQRGVAQPAILGAGGRAFALGRSVQAEEQQEGQEPAAHH